MTYELKNGLSVWMGRSFFAGSATIFILAIPVLPSF
jgi:hypothetical protein